MRCACRRGHTSIRSISVSRDPLAPGPGAGLTPYPPLPSGEGELPTSPLSGTERGSGDEDPGPPGTPGSERLTPGASPGSPGSVTPHQPGWRRGRMSAESAVVEEMPVWLEVNGEPAVTWMCTPDQLEELATG